MPRGDTVPLWMRYKPRGTPCRAMCRAAWNTLPAWIQCRVGYDAAVGYNAARDLQLGETGAISSLKVDASVDWASPSHTLAAFV